MLLPPFIAQLGSRHAMAAHVQPNTAVFGALKFASPNAPAPVPSDSGRTKTPIAKTIRDPTLSFSDHIKPSVGRIKAFFLRVQSFENPFGV